MSVEIRNVTNDKKGMAEFKRLPWIIYKNDPHWAPELIMDLNRRVDKKKHAFFQFGDAEFFGAYKDGKMVGRIAAIENPKHNDYWKENTGFWGFFECENNQETANALFDTAKAWCKAKGRDSLRGPMSCDTQDEVGMLYEGFETIRHFIMPHNPLYYMDLCASYGMFKAKDLIAFRLDLAQEIPEKILRLALLIKEKYEKKGFTFRFLDKKNAKTLTKDFRAIMDIYEAAWAKNWGFTPITTKQFNDMAENMQLVTDKSMVMLIEGPNKEPAGMAVSLYNYMECTRAVRHWPYALQEIGQLLHLALRLFVKPKPKFDGARLFLAGVAPEFRQLGLDAYLYVFPFISGKKLGLKMGELSWELEDNQAILSPIEKMGGKVYKKMRIWDLKI